MTRNIITTDVAIVGAGIAGLWLYNRLTQLGYHCLLLEKEQIGHAQTLSAQGIIHGGSKYALNGILSNAAQAISQMPARWKACLNGTGELDLSQVELFTEHQLLWSTQSLSSKMLSFFASKALQSRMQAIPKAACTGLFADAGFKGTLYQLDEPVLDVHSLLKVLSQQHPQRILKTPNQAAEFIRDRGKLTQLIYGETEIQAQHYVLTAGEGMADLLNTIGLQQPHMQKRPLQMLLCKANHPAHALPQIYAHSLGTGSKPIVTISSHPDAAGNIVWYLGGNIAEQGVGKPADELILEAKALLKQLLPWYQLPELDWTTHNVNRAEPKQSNLTRPDSAFVHSEGNLHVAWPTKLALSPDLADQVIATLRQQGLSKGQHAEPSGLATAQLAEPIWDRAFQS